MFSVSSCLSYNKVTISKYRAVVDIVATLCEASKKYSKRRPNQNFVEMGIPIGSTLVTIDGEYSCTVAEEKKVEYKGEIMSLTRLTRTIRDLKYDIQPAPHWFYEGRSIKEIYEEVYE